MSVISWPLLLTLALALSVLDQASGFVRGEHSHIRGFLRKHLIPMSSFGQQNSHMRFKVGSLREKLNEEAKYINYFRFHKVGEDTDEDNRIALVHDLFRLRPRIEDLVTLQEDERKPEFARDDGSDQRSSWRIIGNSMNKPPLMEDGQSRFALRLGGFMMAPLPKIRVKFRPVPPLIARYYG